MPLTIWNCLGINLTVGGKQAVTWPPIIANRYVNFATFLNSRYI